jgi:arylsulfatase A-like enzyme
LEAYGFSDFVSPGDIIAHTRGGYEFDHLISGSAVLWLRRKGKPLSQANKPWCLFVSLVNPHDVMYFNTDGPGQKVQDTGRLLMRAARAPDHDLYKATWNTQLPQTLREPLDAPGRPKAHGEYLKIWRYLLGEIPLEEDRWRRLHDYYINCIRAVDAEVAKILKELDALNLSERTIIVFTSDHGEQAGAHGLHGKGPFAYHESIHLPFHVVHPDVRPEQDCVALTSHIDMVPTLLAMGGVAPERVGELAGRELPGKDLTPLLSNPGAAPLHAVRDTPNGRPAKESIHSRSAKARQPAHRFRWALQVHTLFRATAAQSSANRRRALWTERCRAVRSTDRPPRSRQSRGQEKRAPRSRACSKRKTQCGRQA